LTALEFRLLHALLEQHVGVRSESRTRKSRLRPHMSSGRIANRESFMHIGATNATQLQRLVRIGLLAAVALALPGMAAAQGKDELWEVTTKMEMPGMPMAMPPQVTRQCVAKSKGDEGYIPARDNCKVLETRRNGNRIAFRMACTGKDAMDATGEITLGNASYDGRMQMTMKAEGQTMTMNNTISGKRVGECTAS
jgi:hypothetical protein